jgi:hypothetical protein
MTADENMKNSEPDDWFEQMFAELNTPESKLRSEKEDRFLQEVLYAGLTDLKHRLRLSADRSLFSGGVPHRARSL